MTKATKQRAKWLHGCWGQPTCPLLLRNMSAIAKVGGWEFDPATRKGTWPQAVARIHDLYPGGETSMELGLSFCHGASRTKIENAVKAAIERGEPYVLELILVSAKGVHKWVQTIGEPRIENGKVVQIHVSFQDITLRKAAEQDVLNQIGYLPSISARP
jgi:PAS domain-containing protein